MSIYGGLNSSASRESADGFSNKVQPDLSVVGEESPSKEVSRVIGGDSGQTKTADLGIQYNKLGGLAKTEISPIQGEFRGEREGLKPTQLFTPERPKRTTKVDEFLSIPKYEDFMQVQQEVETERKQRPESPEKPLEMEEEKE